MTYAATLDYVAPTTSTGKELYASNEYNTSTGAITRPSTTFVGAFTKDGSSRIAYITAWTVQCTCDLNCASDGGCCPGPLVPITMADGSQKLAKDLQAGDKVMGYHEAESRWGGFRVSAVARGMNHLYRVELESGIRMDFARNHRLLDTNNNWLRVDSLRVGTKLFGRLGGVVKAVEDIGWGEVIKITVEDAQTYDTCGLLNHNIKN